MNEMSQYLIHGFMSHITFKGNVPSCPGNNMRGPSRTWGWVEWHRCWHCPWPVLPEGRTRHWSWQTRQGWTREEKASSQAVLEWYVTKGCWSWSWEGSCSSWPDKQTDRLDWFSWTDECESTEKIKENVTQNEVKQEWMNQFYEQSLCLMNAVCLLLFSWFSCLSLVLSCL